VTCETDKPSRLLIVMPSWVGDVVMATPTVRALRLRYPEAKITALVRQSIHPIIDACPWLDQVIAVESAGVLSVARRLRAEKFEMAVLLPNSFRWALAAKLAGVRRVVGYSRDCRGWLLTDRLAPLREAGRFVPVPTLDYYLQIAVHLGCVEPAKRMKLFARPEHDAQADRLLADAGVSGRLVLLAPGAGYGPAKMWPADRFAAMADRCVRELGAAVAVSGSPQERSILDAVLAAAEEPLIDLPAAGIDLTLLKSVVRRSSLMITNDTGTRHIAAAFCVPVVTIFGATDPAWTEIGFEKERQANAFADCAPCQKKVCPLDHRCMTGVSVDMVFEQVKELFAADREGEA